jgi:hypothetical protein
MRAKGNKIAANLKARLKQQPDGRYRFITLTLKHSKQPLAFQIQKLYSSFKKLRNSKAWKLSQNGGAALLEVKYNPEKGEWHPHLHIISEGYFLDKRDLAEQWQKATGDSCIVDIRAMKDGDEVAHYVTKYVAKGTSPSVWDTASAAQEWILASRGVRTLATFGTWRGFKLLQVTADAEAWKPVTTLVNLYAAIERNEAWAMGLLKRLDERRLAKEKTKPPQPVLFEN